MLDYSGHKSEIVDATGSVNEVFERVENIVVSRRTVKKKPAIEHSQSLYNQFIRISSVILKSSEIYLTES